MSCCNACFEVNLGLRSPDQVQGHIFCSVPTEAQKAAYVAGTRPDFYDNRWSMIPAIPCYFKEGEQVWGLSNEYFVVDWEKVEVKEYVVGP